MISYLVPTRGRVDRFKATLKSIKDTASKKVEVVVYVDDDDPCLKEYKAIRGVKFIVGPRIVLSQTWNECAKSASGDILIAGGDDVIFRTPGWDEMVEGAFADCSDKILMVHGDDLAPGGKGKLFGAGPILHRRWVEAVGHFFPPQFVGDYPDAWVNEVANALGRRKLLPFIYEHLDFAWGKVPQDQTNREKVEREAKQQPGELYKRLAPEREADIEKLRAVIEGRNVLWSILILTMPSRKPFLDKLLAVLRPQVEKHPDVEIDIRVSDPSLSLGENREILRGHSKGRYICFVDDDDLVADDYVETIYPLLDGLDYVGFRLQEWVDGSPLPPTFHSLKYKCWSQDAHGYYRDLTLLNPIRRDLAMLEPLEGGTQEDARWASRLSKRGVVKTEHYVDAVMYKYYARTHKSDVPEELSIPRPRPAEAPKPPVKTEWSPQTAANRKACPTCGSSRFVVSSNGRLHCNSCHVSF